MNVALESVFVSFLSKRVEALLALRMFQTANAVDGVVGLQRMIRANALAANSGKAATVHPNEREAA